MMFSARWTSIVGSPSGPRTGMLMSDQWRSVKPEPSASGTSYFWSGMVCDRRVASACSNDRRMRGTPSSSSVSSVGGNASKTGRPTISSRVRPTFAR